MNTLAKRGVILSLFLGSILGSFANVCIYRLPKNQQVISGRSFCPKCKKKIIWYDNIPLISFILLGGKCRKCKKEISLKDIKLSFKNIFIVGTIISDNSSLKGIDI